MKLGIILNTNDAETCWNCFRFANEAIKNNHSVKVFLLGQGVELEEVKGKKFPLLEDAIKKFLKNKGII
ncbi:DsrE family protein, partial [Candidatus Woesearchaeota archaeon]|nr:DsrE family protein [Candidatus Woesearchaeota archaeon]